MIIGFEAQRIFREHKHGMDFVALELIRSLQKLDSKNQYVVFTNEGPDKSCLEESENLTIVTFEASFPVWEQYLLPKYAAKHNCEVLHCTSNTAPVYTKIPTVVTLHDIIYLEGNPLHAKGYTRYQRFGNYYRRLVVRAILSKAKKIVTVSEFEKTRIIDFLGLDTNFVDVVYNGVGGHFFQIHNGNEVLAIRDNYNLPSSYILFLGNTDPKKNTRNTILAFARFSERTGSDYNLVVADLDGKLVHDILASEGLERHMEKIHFSGYIDNRDLPAIIQGAELFLYPSKRESFGIPILEAMACGTPVITSDVASMPEVSGGCAYLVDPFSTDSISKAIEDVAFNEELKDKLSRVGKERAESFQWENSASKMMSIYNELI